MTCTPSQLLQYDVRLALLHLVARKVSCVDRIAVLMEITCDDVWARLDGRVPLTLTDISDIAFMLGYRPEMRL